MADEADEEIEKTVKTTIKLADKLWRDVKVYAAKKGLKLTQVVEAALREYVKEEEPTTKEGKAE
jgi:predicted DNA binding CopG/RHH family protein